MTPDALSALHRAAFAPARGWSAQEISDLMARPHVHVFTRPSAFLLAQIIAPEAEVLTLATDPSCRRQGCATALLRDLETHSGVDTLLLEVASDNSAALGLYTSYGFVPVGLRTGYYARPTGAVDAVLMRKAVGLT